MKMIKEKEKDKSPQFMIVNETDDGDDSISDCTSILTEEIINYNEKEPELNVSETEVKSFEEN